MCCGSPVPAPSEYIDRAAEARNARIAAAAGVNAQVLHFEVEDGTMLARYIDDSLTMSEAAFKDLARVERAAHAFRRMHRFSEPFAGRFDVFAQIDEYLALLRRNDAKIPDGYEALQKEADAARLVLGERPAALAPCHNDPLAENFLDAPERMFLVDWEYAGMNDPMWDLGDLSVEAGFSPEQDEALLRAYFEGRAARGPAWPHGAGQGPVRPGLDALGPFAGHERQPGRGFLGLLDQPLRALQAAAGERAVRRRHRRGPRRVDPRHWAPAIEAPGTWLAKEDACIRRARGKQCAQHKGGAQTMGGRSMHAGRKIGAVALALAGLGLAGLGFAGGAKAQVPETEEPIKLTLHDWTGQLITTEIMGKVLE